MNAEQEMAPRADATRGRRPLHAGSRVTVVFGGFDSEAVVVRRTITGRYEVEVTIDGTEHPVMTTYARDEIRVA